MMLLLSFSSFDSARMGPEKSSSAAPRPPAAHLPNRVARFKAGLNVAADGGAVSVDPDGVLLRIVGQALVEGNLCRRRWLLPAPNLKGCADG